MQRSAGKQLRPLTAQEEIYWLCNYNHPIHHSLAAQVTGRTTPQQWTDALACLQRRHPLLSVSIQPASSREPNGSLFHFHHHDDATIPLRVLPLARVQRWEAEMEREMEAPFGPGQAPLLRAVLLHSQQRCVLILAVSHSIADGISASLLMRDTVRAVADQSLPPLEFPRSAEELLAVKPPASSASLSVSSVDFTRQPVKDGSVTVSALRLSQELTETVRQVSRAHGLTLHSALAAAVVTAMRRQAPQRFAGEKVVSISPVNTRPHLAPAAQDDCGLYFTSPQTAYQPAAGFWDMTRQTRDDVTAAATAAALTGATQAMQGMVAAGLTLQTAEQLLHQAFYMDLLLTNFGVTQYETQLGQLKLDWLSGPACLGALPHLQTVGAATTNGQLSLVHTSLQPITQLLETTELVLSDICAQQQPTH